MKEQGLFIRPARRSRCTRTPVLELSTSSQPGPGRGGRRTAWRCAILPRSFISRSRRSSSRRRPRAAGPTRAAWEAEGGTWRPRWRRRPDAAPMFDLQLDAWTASCHHGSVVIARSPAARNTSNPSVMIAAGLVARSGGEGLEIAAVGKTSLAPGSKVVTGPSPARRPHAVLEQLRFHSWLTRTHLHR